MEIWTWLIEGFRGALFGLTHVYGGSVGAAILTLSIVVRVALLPVTVRAARQRLRMAAAQRKIQPQLEKLQRRWKEDPARLNAEVLGLYKRHGIRPLRDSGFGGMLLQLPFVAALYTVIRQGAGAAGRFLWIRDLARPDVALAGIASALTALVTLATPGAPGSGARIVMVISMLFTFLVLTRLAAGVGLYWAASSAVGAVQGILLRRLRTSGA
jgi:YidC/Oxa1 family membrane protein insertase